MKIAPFHLSVSSLPSLGPVAKSCWKRPLVNASRVFSPMAARRVAGCARKAERRKQLTVCHNWSPFGSGAAPKQDQVRVEWSKWIGPIVTIVIFLISQSRLEGAIQQELKIFEKNMDRLEGRVENLGDKIDKVSLQVSELGREVSYLQGQKSGGRRN